MNNFWRTLALFFILKADCQPQSMRQADSLLRVRNYHTAEKTINDLIAGNPADASLYFRRAVSRQGQKKDEEACQDLERAWKLGYRDPDFYYYRGLCHFFAKHYGKAIDDLSTFLGRKKYNADAYFYRGICYFVTGRDADCIRDQAWCQSMDPDNSLSYYYSGVSRYQLKDYRTAEKNLDKAISLKRSPEYFRYRAITRYHLGSYEAGIEDLNECIKFNPRDYELYHQRGMHYLMEGKDEQAISDFSSAIGLNHGSWKSFYYRAWTRSVRGDTAGACADLLKAKEGSLRLADELAKTLKCSN